MLCGMCSSVVPALVGAMKYGRVHSSHTVWFLQLNMSHEWCCGLTATATRLTKNQNVGGCRSDTDRGLMECHSCVDG